MLVVGELQLPTCMHTMQEWSANAVASPSAGEPPVWAHRCGWEELAILFAVDTAARVGLDLGAGSVNRWSAVWRSNGAEATCLLRDLAEIPAMGCEPVRRFSWRVRAGTIAQSHIRSGKYVAG